MNRQLQKIKSSHVSYCILAAVLCVLVMSQCAQASGGGAYTISVETDKQVVGTDGDTVDSCTVTATVLNNGNPVSGHNVTFSVIAPPYPPNPPGQWGTWTPSASGNTNASGQFAATYNSLDQTMQITIKAEDTTYGMYTTCTLCVDGIPPGLSIAGPPGDEIHAPGAITITGGAYEGPTPSDNPPGGNAGVDWSTVKVAFTDANSTPDEDDWEATSHSSGTTWSYYWASPTSRKIWATAKDLVGNTACISRYVTVTTATIHYVKYNSANPLDGTTWDKAFHDIQSGIDASSAGDEVWVAGTHTYGQNITLSSSAHGNGVAVYGGFAGNEDYREQRDWTTNVTTIDGNYSGSVVFADSTSNLNTRLDGFTITNGTGRYFWPAGCFGGGICLTGYAVISNCFITGNDVDADGGGIYANADCVIWNCRVTDNSAGDGGGIALWACTASVLGNTISGNTTTLSGGGINCAFVEGEIAYNVIGEEGFGNTTGEYGGGISSEGNTNPTIRGNVIQYNTSDGVGGGISLEDASDVQVEDNTFISNHASGEGGGVVLTTGCDSVTISGNTFTGNSSGISGGAVTMDASSSISIVNNILVGNHTNGDANNGLGGGALHASSSEPAIVNNTFVSNYVGTGTWPNITVATYGGAVHVKATSNTTLVNNIFYDNKAQYGRSVASTYSGDAAVSYCDAYPGTESENYYSLWPASLTVGSGLLDDDPTFCGGSAQSQYWLAVGSPCRGTGQVAAPAPSEDLDGRTRPGSDNQTDMGAYENDNRACP